ncbi:hypothetical protein IMG5_059230 [Ichthyophthirius multifiliis]|uniref:Transmembrane protein n=1 Tax=Ichthyophthirius multifiliis TaxID=5932 RepID=G0QNJ4_ICHMU|nr:hypothetical protein IMG5_059230 [Ichthyophthirius multifiliis]EGR33210.1 hypothetical protein IMG5_059230 [Ichthyophthirius multifiliis]|eukprot:XP_004037196.1 hypothetical protein IMG5_059230 [Ichthyophthirius multifiliis]
MVSYNKLIITQVKKKKYNIHKLKIKELHTELEFVQQMIKMNKGNKGNGVIYNVLQLNNYKVQKYQIVLKLTEKIRKSQFNMKLQEQQHPHILILLEKYIGIYMLLFLHTLAVKMTLLVLLLEQVIKWEKKQILQVVLLIMGCTDKILRLKFVQIQITIL